MMTWNKIIILIGLVVLPKQGVSQVLSLDQFLRQVMEEHPKSKEIMLSADKASALYLKYRGNFDPVLSFDVDQKEFQQKSYYHMVNGNVKIPTNFGLEFKSGYEWSRGLYLNPESVTPGGGLLFAGASLPLGKGLLIDEKRARRSQAKIGLGVADAEIREDMNRWLFEAIHIYLEWQQMYMTVDVLKNALETIEERKNAVVMQVQSGDRPQIDTVEIGIQQQLIELSLRQAELELGKAQWKVETSLWKNNEPDGLQSNISPERTVLAVNQGAIPVLDELTFQSKHPALTKFELNRKQLDIERRFIADKLKPGLWLSYNPLFEPIGGGNPFAGFRWDNQKWGLSFSMPLFLRKERGDLKKTEADLLGIQYKRQDKFAELYASYRAYVLELTSLQSQFDQYEQIVERYAIMYASEKNLFTIGESSLFLVNARQQVLIQAELKKIELGIKLKKAFFGVMYSIGDLPLNF